MKRFAMLTKKVLGAGCLVAILLALSSSVSANVGDPSRWKPAFDETFTSPPPADAEARVKAFAERNSKVNVEELARGFFSLIDLTKVPQAVRVAADKGDYESALNAYRDFFMDRLGTFDPDEATNAGIRPRKPPIPFEKAYLHTADDLMNNTAVYGMIHMPLPPDVRVGQDYYNIVNNPKNAGIKGNVRIVFGEPGRANWTWQPEQFIPIGYPHLPFDRTFMSTACGRPHFFTALLVKYIETRDRKYWDKWLGFADDICINWRRDTMQAGLNPSHNQNNVEFFDDGVWANLSFMMHDTPDLVRGIPAPTLARMLNRMWMEYMSDTLQYARNASTARRIMFDTFHGVRIATSFPEFKASSYCVRESVRALESLPMLSIMPDGTDVHDSRNYNKGTAEYLEMVYGLLRKTGQAPPWVNDQWLKDQYECQILHANFIIRELYATGDYPHWSLFHAERDVFVGKNPFLKRFVPEAFAQPDNAKIISNIFEDGSAGQPSFTSDAFPFGGYYCIRSGWGKQDQWLYVPSTRPVSSITRPNNNNFHLYAFGRNLLADRAMTTPVHVDQCNQIDNGSFGAAPESYRNDIYRPVYGRAGSTNAYRTPLKRRWHTSEFFDLVETDYSGPYARLNPAVFIGDVVHERQFLFARKLGVWVITDRMKSPTPHTYDWAWPFHCPAGDDAKRYPGFKTSEVARDAKEQSIKTTSPDFPNLSLYSHATEPMEMTQFGFTARGKSDWMVVSTLYPRNVENGSPTPDLAEMKTLNGPGGECGFSAQVPGGARVLYLAASKSGKITLENIEMDGESLLLTIMPDGGRHGVALGCKQLQIAGAAQAIPAADFEFTTRAGGIEKSQVIYRPLDLPIIGPAEDRFDDQSLVTMSHDDPAVDIRYTLDGADPTGESPLYVAPIRLVKTTVVKSRAFRKGITQVPQTSDATHVSSVVRAVFTKEAAWEPMNAGETHPGVAYTLYEDDGAWPISAFNLDALKSVGHGVCRELFDTSATKMTHGGFAFVYSGYLNVPQTGVYSFHAPREFITPSVHAGYDLRVYLDGREWYPATQTHDFGVWSIPLKSGKHAFKVVYINQQNVRLMTDLENWKDFYWQGDKPGLTISGPGLKEQAIPAGMLFQ